MRCDSSSNGVIAETTKAPTHVCICICTFQRPELLRRLLESLLSQRTSAGLAFSVVIADNDGRESARPVVVAFADRAPFPVQYCVEPLRNIALVRNRAIQHACGDYIAFIDDDEFPTDEWLEKLFFLCATQDVAGVLGPVRPHFDSVPSRWIILGGFCERPEHPTGMFLEWWQGRTGNVLFRRAILNDIPEPFRAEFGTGGEDQDFFRRMMKRGHRFAWCNEAIVYETVPAARQTRRYMLRRALLRGRNSLKHPEGRWLMIAKSLAAVPIYLLTLPLMLLRGHHWFMRYLVKLCDHLGRLLALVGIKPVQQREM